ncbi:MAG TPA: hydrogenase iron-sulfur subunit [Thermoplasmata archaeon]
MSFEPKLMGFMCNWCSYAGADLAGVSRYQYPPDIRIVKVMCSARVDPDIVLEMFIQGADGVFVGGCHIGDCHYIKGNYYAQQRMKVVKRLLGKCGFEPERLRLEWVSASEGERFARLMTEFTAQVSALGPSPVSGEQPDIKKLRLLFAAKSVVADVRVRALLGKYVEFSEKGNVFGRKLSEEDLDALLDSVMDDEFARINILLAASSKPISVKELAADLNLSATKVLQHIVTLKERDLMRLSRIEGVTPFYQTVQGVAAGGV